MTLYLNVSPIIPVRIARTFMHYQDERTTGCRISDSWTYRGLKTVVLENELLRVSIISDKGADVFELTHKKTDTEFMWRTPWSVRNQSLSTPPTGNGWLMVLVSRKR